MSLKYNDEEFILVKTSDINKLNDSKIEYIDLEDKQYYVVSQGKKNKRFNPEQVLEIKKDLDNGLSIRKCATKWNTDTKLIMKIKKNEY